MSYQSLYRAFRPTTLDGLVRQEHIVKILTNQIETAVSATPISSAARAARAKRARRRSSPKAINCLHPKNGSPCGECEACRALSDPSNLDIIRNRRRIQQRRQRDARPARKGAVSARRLPLQGIYRRRSAHALRFGVQRPF